MGEGTWWEGKDTRRWTHRDFRSNFIRPTDCRKLYSLTRAHVKIVMTDDGAAAAFTATSPVGNEQPRQHVLSRPELMHISLTHTHTQPLTGIHNALSFSLFLYIYIIYI